MRIDSKRRTISVYSACIFNRKDNNIFVEIKATKKKIYLPVESVSHILIYSKSDFNTDFFTFLSKSNVMITFADYYGWIKGHFMPTNFTEGGVIISKQAILSQDEDRKVILSKSMLLYQAVKMNSIVKNNNWEQSHKDKIISVQSIESSLGVEGNMRKSYYKYLDENLPKSFRLRGRSYQSPNNRMNVLINFTYGKLYSFILNEIRKTSLHPAIGIIHSLKRYNNSYPLVYDFSDIFKPFCDLFLIKEINNGTIYNKMFSSTKNIYQIKKKYIKELGDIIDFNILKTKEYSIGNYTNITLSSLIRMEFYLYIKYLINENKNYAPSGCKT